MTHRFFTLVSAKDKTPEEAAEEALALLKQKGVVFDEPESEDGGATSQSD